MKQWMRVFFIGVLFLFSTIGVAANSLRGSPIIRIFPNSTTPISIAAGQTATPKYFIFNNTKKTLKNLIYTPNFNLGPLVSASILISTCPPTLKPKNGCMMTLLVHANNNVGTTTLEPRVCAFSGLLCSIPTIGNRVPTSVKTLQSISISPSSTQQLPAGSTVQFSATGTYSDGSTANITSSVTWSSSNAAAATITSTGLATLGTTPGTSTSVTATLGSSSASVMVIVRNAALVSIAVTPTSPSVNLGVSQQFIATGTFTDGTTADITTQVNWSSSDISKATIGLNTGFATTLAAGSTTIMASLNGVSGTTNLTINPSVLVSINISPAGIQSVPKGKTLQFTAFGTYTDGSTVDITSQVTWHSTLPANVSINSSGLAAAIGLNGSASHISATDGAINSNQTVINVTTATLTSIAVTPSPVSIPAGATQPFTATGTYSDGSTGTITSGITWVSSVPSLATIDSTGLATATSSSSRGTTTITAQVGSITSPGVSATIVDPVLLSITVTPSAPAIILGATQQFTATGYYSDGSTADLTSHVTTVWASSNIATATINATGLATSVAAGTTNITANYGSITSAPVTLTVNPVVLTSIAITPSGPVTLPNGTQQQFTATGTYNNGSTANITNSVTWNSSNTSAITISNTSGSNGLATAVAGSGSSFITATLGSITSSNTVTVTAATATLQSITVTPTSASIFTGNTQQFAATGHYSDGTTPDITNLVTWASSDTSKATISNTSGSNGLASGVAVTTGTTNITASYNSVTSNSAPLTVTPVVLTSIAITPSTAQTLPHTAQLQFTATGTYNDGHTADITTSVTWNSSNTSAITISNTGGSNGLATAVASSGSSAITATMSSITSNSVTVTAVAATLQSIAVTPNPASVNTGSTLQFTATGTYSDSTTADITNLVTWSSSDTSKASISNTSGSNGLATGLTAGTTTITATSGSITSPGVTLTVASSATLTSISITPTTTALRRNVTWQMTATGHYSDSSTQDLTSLVTWNSSNASAATINSSGLLSTTGNLQSTDVTATYQSTTSNIVTIAVSYFAYVDDWFNNGVSICPIDNSTGLFDTCIKDSSGLLSSVSARGNAFHINSSSNIPYLYIADSGSAAVLNCPLNADGSLGTCLSSNTPITAGVVDLAFLSAGDDFFTPDLSNPATYNCTANGTDGIIGSCNNVAASPWGEGIALTPGPANAYAYVANNNVDGANDAVFFDCVVNTSTPDITSCTQSSVSSFFSNTLGPYGIAISPNYPTENFLYAGTYFNASGNAVLARCLVSTTTTPSVSSCSAINIPGVGDGAFYESFFPGNSHRLYFTMPNSGTVIFATVNSSDGSLSGFHIMSDPSITTPAGIAFD